MLMPMHLPSNNDQLLVNHWHKGRVRIFKKFVKTKILQSKRKCLARELVYHNKL